MLTDKEKMELLNLRKKVVRQRDEIIRLQAVIKSLKDGGDAYGTRRSET